MFSIWPQFGFRENPYNNRNLPADETGHALLVGRDEEIATVQRKIAGAGTHPSVEGTSGVGKSSMVGVAIYRMFAQTVEARDGTLYVPATRFFQVSPGADGFEERVYRDIAQTLIANVEAFRRSGLAIPDISDLDRWLNSPQSRTGGGTIGPIGGNYGTTQNEAIGFAESGFAEAVRTELRRCFPAAGAGAVVCVLDNLEILQTSAAARATLEELRDRLFTIDGLRWVLCGSRGIVTHARSQRLSGVFDAPLQLPPLPDAASIDLIARRLDYYGQAGALAPVTPEAFEFVYRALHTNLRDALAYAQSFSDWLYAEYVIPDRPIPTDRDRFELLEIWLAQQSDAAYHDARLQPRTWRFFDDLARAGGRCGASEWEDYGFGTQQQMGTNVTNLVNAQLVVRETDPQHASRTIATVTAQGWLVYFHRNRYGLPEGEGVS